MSYQHDPDTIDRACGSPITGSAGLFRFHQVPLGLGAADLVTRVVPRTISSSAGLLCGGSIHQTEDSCSQPVACKMPVRLAGLADRAPPEGIRLVAAHTRAVPICPRQ